MPTRIIKRQPLVSAPETLSLNQVFYSCTSTNYPEHVQDMRVVPVEPQGPKDRVNLDLIRLVIDSVLSSLRQDDNLVNSRQLAQHVFDHALLGNGTAGAYHVSPTR